MADHNTEEGKFRDAVEDTVVEISRQHAELTADQLWDLIIKINRPGINKSPWLVQANIRDLVVGLIQDGRVVGRVETGRFLRPTNFFFDVEANLKLASEEHTQLDDTSSMIKRTILDLGTKFTRLQVAEIAEICEVEDEGLIIEIIQDMIAKHQVDAQYFTRTKAVAFNQQANLASRDAFIAELDAEFATWGKKEQAGKTS